MFQVMKYINSNPTKLYALKVYSLNFMNFEAFCTRWKGYYPIIIGILWAGGFHCILGKETVKKKNKTHQSLIYKWKKWSLSFGSS